MNVSIVDTLVSMCDEILNATGDVSAKVTDAIPPDVTSTTSTDVTSTVSV